MAKNGPSPGKWSDSVLRLMCCTSSSSSNDVDDESYLLSPRSFECHANDNLFKPDPDESKCDKKSFTPTKSPNISSVLCGKDSPLFCGFGNAEIPTTSSFDERDEFQQIGLIENYMIPPVTVEPIIQPQPSNFVEFGQIHHNTEEFFPELDGLDLDDMDWLRTALSDDSDSQKTARSVICTSPASNMSNMRSTGNGGVADSKKRTSIGEMHRANEMNSNLQQAVRYLKALRHMTKGLVTEIIPYTLSLYMSGIATTANLNMFLDANAIFSIPCQQTLASRLSPGEWTSEFTGIENIAFGSTQLRDVMNTLTALRLNGNSIPPGYLSFTTELMDADSAIVSNNSGSICLNFMWRSSGLTSLGFGAELCVPILVLCNQVKSKLTRMAISFDSALVFRQLGIDVLNMSFLLQA
eukprot:gene1664-3215_t